MQPTIYHRENQPPKLRLAGQLTERLRGILEEDGFEIFEFQSLEALKLMLNAFHEAIRAYEEQERQDDSPS